MALPGMTRSLNFSHRIRGAFGTFTSSGNRQIMYLSTRFDKQHLAEVRTARQVLPRHMLHVSELMQRDIDDDRVRTEIISYLNPPYNVSNSRFFPPLVVGLLPRTSFGSAEIAPRYPTPELITDGAFPHRQDPADNDIWYENRIYGDVFGIRVPLENAEMSIDVTPFFHAAELLWNDHHAYLFAIDGQHRLIALQALLGILSADERVRGYAGVAMSETQLRALGFGSIPVCVVFPPLLYENNTALDQRDTVVTVCRELFVDINKNAKVVSESRNILLNERDAIAVFTRNTVNQFVIEGDLPRDSAASSDQLPLYAFEFESDAEKVYQITDPRAVCSIGLLRVLIGNILLREDSGEDLDRDTFRDELGVEADDEALIGDATKQLHGVPPLEIDERRFEPWQLTILEKRYAERWQFAVVAVLRGLFPADELIGLLETRRLDLLRRVRQNSDDWAAKHALTYLLGTRVDQRQIEFGAKLADDEVSGLYEPLTCAKAIKEIKGEFFDSLRKAKAKGFARLFFSLVGQTELFRFVFVVLRNNCNDASPQELASAYVEDFNTAFKKTTSERLFSSDQEWNEPVIKRLATNQYIRDHLAGLFQISVAFMPADGALASLMGGQTEWNKVRSVFVGEGYQSINGTLSDRLRNQVQRTTEMALIESKTKRTTAIEKKVRSLLGEIIDRLKVFVAKTAEDGDRFVAMME